VKRQPLNCFKSNENEALPRSWTRRLILSSSQPVSPGVLGLSAKLETRIRTSLACGLIQLQSSIESQCYACFSASSLSQTMHDPCIYTCVHATQLALAPRRYFRLPPAVDISLKASSSPGSITLPCYHFLSDVHWHFNYIYSPYAWSIFRSHLSYFRLDYRILLARCFVRKATRLSRTAEGASSSPLHYLVCIDSCRAAVHDTEAGLAPAYIFCKAMLYHV
jgi:hypothetical protein